MTTVEVADKTTKGAKKQKSSLFMTPLSSIFAKADFNLRPELPKIPELAALIKVNGGPSNITPIVVEKVGENGSTRYEVVTGNRRLAALHHLKTAGNVEIPVQLKEYSDVIEQAFENIVENTGREEVHPRWLAKRLTELKEGTFQGGSEKVPVKTLSERTDLAVSTIQNFIRCEKNLDEGVKTAWFKKNIPFSIVLGWASLEPEAQLAELEAWMEAQKELAASGRKRKSSTKGGSKTRGAAEEEEDEEEVQKRSVKDMRDKLELLEERAELTEKQMGMVAALKWCLGINEVLR